METTKLNVWQRIWKHRALLLMLLPGLLFVIVFNYLPLYGLQIAFKDFRVKEGIWGSSWVGLKHFRALFSDPYSVGVIRNTIVISLQRLLFGFPAPIILALFLNEIGNKYYKKVAQTVSYMPHFLSWVILSGMIISILSPNNGVINHILGFFGVKPIFFLTSVKWFRPILIVTGIWKEIGWGSIIYLAAISSIDAEQYEAAIVDGATRLQRMRYITLPSMLPLISVVLVLNMGGIMNAGFDQIFNLYNASVKPIADIIDTYVYDKAFIGMQYSFSAAVGFFKSVVGLVLLVTVQTLTSKLSGTKSGLW